MKRIIFFILLFVSICGFSQTEDGTLRLIDWKTVVKNVVLVNDSTYIFDADPIDLNDKGAIEREIGNYFVDFVGNRYKIIDSTLTTITVLDEYRKNVAPQSDQLGRVYQSVGDGEMDYVGGVDLTVLDELSKWKVQAADNQYWWELINGKNPYIGIVDEPIINKNGDGSFTIQDNGTYIFNEQADGKGKTVKFKNVSDTTLTVTDNAVSFVYVDYNGGNPFYTFTSDNTIFFNEATKLFVVCVTRLGNQLHFEEYGEYGVLLANKHLLKDILLTTFQRQSGLILSTTGTRISNISAGSAWFSINKFSLDANISGSEGLLYEYYLSSGIWNYQEVTAYDASYYSDLTDRQILGNNKYVAKYFFRDVGDDNESYYFHGNQYNTEAEAKNEIMPAPPPTVSAHAIYVGKIVVKQGATIGTAYPRAWEGAIQSAGVFNHFDLSLESLNWTGSGHYDGENKIAAFDSTGLAISIDDNSTLWNNTADSIPQLREDINLNTDTTYAHNQRLLELEGDTSKWNLAYINRITSLTTTGNSGAATLLSNVLNIPNYTISGLGGVSGSGTQNYISKFTGSSALGNSQIFDNGTNVGIGTASPSQQLELTKNFRLPLTTYNSGNPYGIIYKGTIPFIHDFNYGNNGTVTTRGDNLFIGNAGNFTMGSTATSQYQSSFNIGIGNFSLGSLTTGRNNVAFGAASLYGLTIGANNTAVGIAAGTYYDSENYFNVTNANSSVFLGSDTRPLTDNGNNEIVIGVNTDGHGSNTATIGNDYLLRTYLVGVNLRAGTSLNAPLIMDAGSNLLSPQTGAFEFNGSRLFFTPSSTRETVAFLSDIDTSKINSAYNNQITSLGVTGTTTKTITATQQDGGTVTTTFIDLVNDADSDPTNELITSVFYSNDSLKITEAGITHKVKIEAGGGWDYTTQTLTGTTPDWNVDNGLNAKITLTGATTITFSNLEEGMEGLLTVTNGSSSTYYITFKGYTFDISIAVWRTDTQVAVSGSSKIDKFSWKYDGTTVSINGAFDYKRYTF